MSKRRFETAAAPKPGGLYSQAIGAGNMVFLSGQLPIDADTGQLVDGSVQDMYRQCFRNLGAVCRAAGGTLDDVVRLGVYFTDPAYAPAVDEVMSEFFSAPFPARTRVTVKQLSRGAAIEIDGIMVVVGRAG